jgi:hypothetical protein
MKILRAGKTGPPEALIHCPGAIAALGGFTFLVCYLRSFHFPNIPFLLWGDALGYATNGVRMLGGSGPSGSFSIWSLLH